MGIEREQMNRSCIQPWVWSKQGCTFALDATCSTPQLSGPKLNFQLRSSSTCCAGLRAHQRAHAGTIQSAMQSPCSQVWSMWGRLQADARPGKDTAKLLVAAAGGMAFIFVHACAVVHWEAAGRCCRLFMYDAAGDVFESRNKAVATCSTSTLAVLITKLQATKLGLSVHSTLGMTGKAWSAYPQ